MKSLSRYAVIFLMGLSLASCTSSIFGVDEDDPIIKPPPPNPPPPKSTGYVIGADTTDSMYA